MRDLLVSVEGVPSQGLKEAVRNVVGSRYLWDLRNHFDILLRLVRQIIIRFVGEFLLGL